MQAPPDAGVAIVAFKPYIGISSFVLNTMTALADAGYAVDVFAVPQDDRFGLPDFTHRGIRFVAKRRSPDLFLLRDLGQAIRYRRPPRSYEFVIGVDPEGLLQAALFARLWRIPYVYLSLELLDSSNGRWRLAVRKYIESLLARRAALTLTQDPVRADILAADNGIPREQVTVVYNASRGRCLPGKDRLLRQRFGIRDDAIVVLAIGSLLPEHSIDKIIASAQHWDDRFVLVVHGWFADRAFERHVRALVAGQSQRVHLSTDLLPLDDRFRLFQAADVGLVFFEPVARDYTYAAGSAGKLFDFMRAGVPVVACSLPGIRELVQGNEIGCVVNNVSDIGKGLLTVMGNYDQLKHSALAAFARYEFDAAFAPVLQRIRAGVSRAASTSS